jgi:hypothetical protein
MARHALSMQEATSDPLLCAPPPSFPPPPARASSGLAPLPSSSFPEVHSFPAPPPPSNGKSTEELAADEDVDALDFEALRAKAHAQRCELLRLKPQVAGAESERVKLARRVASLTAERDNYLTGLTQASQHLAAAKRAAAADAEAHARERKEDTQLCAHGGWPRGRRRMRAAEAARVTNVLRSRVLLSRACALCASQLPGQPTPPPR